MKTVCEINKCTGCMACMDICPADAVRIEDQLDACNAVIQEDRCLRCRACYNVCPNNSSVQALKPKEWYQGWAAKDRLRRNGASGGAAAAVAEAFIKNGGIVCACTFRDGEFIYEFADRLEALHGFSGSRYVKSSPHGVYKRIKEQLVAGEKILFIGLPCQAAAVKNYIGVKNGENLFLIDLICHGTPSPKLLELFLEQYGASLKGLKDIRFRAKTEEQEDARSIVEGASDRYSTAFLHGLTYTENCYICPYARMERVSDLTLGDSWGSEMEIEEQKKGISLILCQTEKGRELIDQAELCLNPVDLDKAVENNEQLKFPSSAPKGRNGFFEDVKNGHKFDSAVFRYLPEQCVRQSIKRTLAGTGILRILRKERQTLNYSIIIKETAR